MEVFSTSDMRVDWSQATLSVGHVVHGYTGPRRRVPQFLARGPFNTWDYDKGVTSLMT